jgi:hypothetical protein
MLFFSLRIGVRITVGGVSEFYRRREDVWLRRNGYPPTRDMVREAASVGFADVMHGDIPTLQIVSIEE